MDKSNIIKIEEKLAILEEICDNCDMIENEVERNFIREEIEIHVRELNRIFHTKEFDDGEVSDKFLMLVNVYNRKVMEAKKKGVLKNSRIDTIPFNEELK